MLAINWFSTSPMRTTVNLDPDVFRAAKQLAASRSISVGAALSELARKGIKGAAPEPAQHNGFAVFPRPAGAKTITLEDIKREDDEW